MSKKEIIFGNNLINPFNGKRFFFQNMKNNNKNLINKWNIKFNINLSDEIRGQTRLGNKQKTYYFIFFTLILPSKKKKVWLLFFLNNYLVYLFFSRKNANKQKRKIVGCFDFLVESRRFLLRQKKLSENN